MKRKYKRQDLGYDLYTPQEEPINDWYVVPIAIVAAIVAVAAYTGVELFFNVLVTFFTSI